MSRLLTTLLLATVSGLAMAQTTANTSTADASAPAPAKTEAGSRLIAEFSAFAGSPENAAALVGGLRSGSAIMLTASGSEASGAGRATAVSFQPPTRPMGYGNVRIALALAQARLQSQGISQPTPQQLQIALSGTGSTTTAGTTPVADPGVLQLRAQGLGWGRVAHEMGVKLGGTLTQRPAVPVTTAAPVLVSPGKSSGIVTAGGVMNVGYRHGNGHGPITATGVANGQGHGRGLGKGGK